MSITIVTAYFELEKSKFTHKLYIDWITNFMKIRSNIIIFTNCAEKIKKLRPKYLENKTHYISCNFSDFYVNKYNWEKHWNMDHEKNYHTKELYMIWNEKINFIKRAINVNPFKSEYFYWTDIGAFRLSEQIMRNYINYPVKKMEKIILLNIEDFKDVELENIEIDNRFQYVNRIGGGIFGGNIYYCLKWWEKYYRTLDEFFLKNVFAGKDQSVMAFTALNNLNLVNIVQPSKIYNGDKWFYLEYYLTYL